MYQTWEELEHACLNCSKCGLCEGRTHVVFGAGNQRAKVLFVGEGPGEQEDLQGKPFVGRSGQLLDKMLDAVGLSRQESIFITNMVKCRPPGNRDPQPDEVSTCLKYLHEQIRLIDPQYIVCLGRVAAQSLMDPNFKVTKQHGQFMEKDGVMMMGTFHPAALLRNPSQKADALDDFCKLRDRLQNQGTA